MPVDKSDIPPQERVRSYLLPLSKLVGHYGIVVSRARESEAYSLEVAIGLAAAAAKNLLRCNLDELSYGQANGLLGHLIQYQTLIKKLCDIPWDKQNLALQHFRDDLSAGTVASNTIAQQLNGLAATFNGPDVFKEEYKKYIDEQAAIAATREAELNRKFAELSARSQSDIARIHDLFRAAENARQTYETLAASLQAPAATATSRVNAKHFLAQAKLHRRNAHFWAKSVVWTTVGTIAFAVLCFLVPMFRMPAWLAPHLSEMGTTTHIHIAVGKVLTFSTLVYAIFFFARNYMAQIHNAVVNDHRANALKTYEVIVAAVGDSHKDTVLTKASDCIFSPQPTGFTKHEVADTPAVALLANVATTATRSQQTPGV